MRKIALLIGAVVLAVLGVALARYAEADDAPGGVVIGGLLVAGAVAIGLKGLLMPRSGRPRA